MFEHTKIHIWLKSPANFTKENVLMLAFIAYAIGVIAGSVN